LGFAVVLSLSQLLATPTRFIIRNALIYGRTDMNLEKGNEYDWR
jgi:hypothetical protein